MSQVAPSKTFLLALRALAERKRALQSEYERACNTFDELVARGAERGYSGARMAQEAGITRQAINLAAKRGEKRRSS